METYVSIRQNTVAHFIVIRTIMDLCQEAEQIPRPRVSRQWWYQEGVDVEGIRTVDEEAERTEGEE